MKVVSYFFFYTYTGTVTAAGFWGAFINPEYDHMLLFNLDTASLAERTQIDLLSQYRFLRAIEFGFGCFALTTARQIFHERKFNQLFLFIMASGIMARVAGIIAEGAPDPHMQFFMYYELLGLILIYLHTRRSLHGNL